MILSLPQHVGNQTECVTACHGGDKSAVAAATGRDESASSKKKSRCLQATANIGVPSKAIASALPPGSGTCVICGCSGKAVSFFQV